MVFSFSRGPYTLLPTNNNGDVLVPPSRTQRWLRVTIVLVCLVSLALGVHLWGGRIAVETVAPGDLKEPEPDHVPQLADLGKIAEERYKIGFSDREEGINKFYTQLDEFIKLFPASLQNPLSASLHSHVPPSHPDIIGHPALEPVNKTLPLSSYRTIFQTDKKPWGEWSTEWQDMNRDDGWTVDFYRDDRAQEWVDGIFDDRKHGVLGVQWAWHAMHRGVLKADFLRYLLPLLKGGMYTDTDTRPHRRIDEWGKTDPEVMDLTETDGPDWASRQSAGPAVMVGIETDVHEHPVWFMGWPRPLGICQWALGSAPYHPIMLEATRRVVNNTIWTAEHSKPKEEPKEPKVKRDKVDLQDWTFANKTTPLNVVEWTGPGMFTDAVLAYLLARYNVTWHRLRGLDHPLRIGEVVVLPITAFSPGGEPDFMAEGTDSPQCDLMHYFTGSWKPDGW